LSSEDHDTVGVGKALESGERGGDTEERGGERRDERGGEEEEVEMRGEESCGVGEER
jgi:hypothetical protein